MNIDDQTRSQLAVSSQLSQADDLESAILCNIIINTDKVRDYFFSKIDENQFFAKPFYLELFKIIQCELQHKKPISFDLLESNPKISDRTSLDLLKQFSQQHQGLMLNSNSLSWENEARKIFENHHILWVKAQLICQMSRLQNEAANIDNLDHFNKVSDKLGQLFENCKGQNLNFDEAQSEVSDENVALPIIDNIFAKDSYLPTGFYNYDKIHKGFPLGSLVMMAATSGAGKSMVALNLAVNAFSQGKRVCLVSLEMTDNEIMKRMLCIVANQNLTKGEDPLTTIDFLREMTPEEVSKFKERLKRSYQNELKSIKSKFPEANLTFRCTDNDMTLDKMLAMLKNYKFDLIIVDYIGLLSHSGKADQWQELSQDARNAKIFAQENNNVVVLLAQRERDKDVSFSRALIHHANVFWIWEKIKDGEKDSIKCKRDPDDTRNNATYITTVEILKNRNSSQRPFVLKLDYAKMLVNGGSDDPTDAAWSVPDIINTNLQQSTNRVRTKEVKEAESGESQWD